MSSHPAEGRPSQSAIPNSIGASVADNTASSSNTSSAHFPSTRGGRGQWRGRWRGSGKAGRQEAREGNNDTKEVSQLGKSDKPRPRPTHCESLSFSTNICSSDAFEKSFPSLSYVVEFQLQSTLQNSFFKSSFLERPRRPPKSCILIPKCTPGRYNFWSIC